MVQQLQYEDYVNCLDTCVAMSVVHHDI